jgi:diaminohydroxyphosphoribosylaminopyrimidine deaminase/5-amino-6-(5-phosphoribosylamino)uracil reductase
MGGADFLRNQGLEVVSGVLEEVCRRLNYPFIKHSVSGLPWIVMKAGMSLDCMISRRQGHGGAITGEESRLRVHELRNRLDALLIGIGTAVIDDPSLTTRLPGGGRDPLRVILDSHLKLPPDAQMLRQQSSAATWIFCGPQAKKQSQEQLEKTGAVVYRTDTDSKGRLDLLQVLQKLGKADVTSVLVEGGAGIHGSFLRAKLVDQAFLFVAPYFVGEDGTSLIAGYSIDEQGTPITLSGVTTEAVGQDILIQGLVDSL